MPGTTTKPAALSPASARLLIGRHPILDRQRAVVGYELLLQASNPLDEAETAPEEATARVISDTVLSFGLDALTHGRRAFIRMPPAFLRHEVLKLLPATRVVLQVPYAADDLGALVDACRQASSAGYKIALEDVAPDAELAPLLSLVDFIKVDFLATPGRVPEMYQLASPGGRAVLIAGRIEKIDVFEAACRQGFHHFQGFFFGEPVAVESRALSTGRVGHLRLLRALNDPNLSLAALEDLVKHDAMLCHRILRAVNSAAFAQRHEVTSMHHALLLLGRDTIRRWASLWLLAELGTGAPSEVVINASVRARFCEQLAARTGGEETGGEGFLIGMCSLLDVMLGRPIGVVLEELQLSPNVAAAILGRDSAARRILDLVIAYERGDWPRCLALAEAVGVDPATLRSAYLESLRWANELCQPAAAGSRVVV